MGQGQQVIECGSPIQTVQNDPNSTSNCSALHRINCMSNARLRSKQNALNLYYVFNAKKKCILCIKLNYITGNPIYQKKNIPIEVLRFIAICKPQKRVHIIDKKKI